MIDVRLYPNRPMNEVLTDLINGLNNTNFKVGELTFGDPSEPDDQGYIHIPVRLVNDSDEDERSLRVFKIDVKSIIREDLVILNLATGNTEAIIEGLQKQYGIYLDPLTYTLEDLDPEPEPEEPTEEPLDPDLPTEESTEEPDELPTESPSEPPTEDPDGEPVDPELPTEEPDEPLDPDPPTEEPELPTEEPLDPEEEPTEEPEEPEEEIPTEEPPPPPLLSDKRYLLTILDNHLFLSGELKLRLVPNLDLLGTSISSLMDLREYLSTSVLSRYPIETYTHSFEMGVTDKEVSKALFLLDVNEPNLWLLTEVLKSITNDEWVVEEDYTPFNLFDVKVLYNGLRNNRHTTVAKNYTYVVELELGWFNSNLVGTVCIGYNHSVIESQRYTGGRYVRPVPIFNPR